MTISGGGSTYELGKEVGPKRTEIDVAVALNRMPRQDLTDQRSSREIYHDFRRNLREEFADMKKDELPIDYIPVRFYSKANFTADQAFIEPMQTL